MSQNWSVLYKGQTKTSEKAFNNLNKPKKGGGSGSTGGIEHSQVAPATKLRYKSLTPGLTTQLPVLSSATGVLGYW